MSFWMSSSTQQISLHIDKGTNQLRCATRYSKYIKCVPAATGNCLCLLHANVREEAQVISFTRSSYLNIDGAQCHRNSLVVEHIYNWSTHLHGMHVHRLIGQLLSWTICDYMHLIRIRTESQRTIPAPSTATRAVLLFCNETCVKRNHGQVIKANKSALLNHVQISKVISEQCSATFFKVCPSERLDNNTGGASSSRKTVGDIACIALSNVRICSKAYGWRNQDGFAPR